ncbi:hypothetical protein [Legionella worsleiensis]|uniref:Transmembrane protein n=1 Tax=Legionella worsleiensis TaxID=45076 RepID=A0A0W1AF87_9GAMM|nr:hypothetical protein [Legionella worsleiensis]KTD79994.1 hypothetical protein Lwor_1508 [Legionella worsleiensis]STY32466.1 Uncharacterised protein [Legionella worsleiensis]
MITWLHHLEGYLTEYFSLGKTFLKLIRYETRLAGQSIIPLVLTLCMFFVILITTWFTMAVLFGCGVYALSGSFAVSCSAVLVLNLLILFILMQYLTFNLKNMSFINTREFLSNAELNKHELTEPDEKRDSVDNKTIKNSSTPITPA